MNRTVIASLTSLSLLAGAATILPFADAASAAPAATAAAPTPAAPASVTTRPIGRTALALRWPQVAGAESYDLYAKDAITGRVVGPVRAAGVQGEVPGLTVGRSYFPGVAARNASGTSATRWGTAVTVLADARPAPVTNLRAVASTTSTRVTVSWTNPTTGVQPDSFVVGVTTPAGILIGSYATCDYPCVSRTVDGLEPGTYRVRVAPLSMSGGVGSWAVTTSNLNVVDGCATGGACVTVSGGSDRGPAALRAQGINSGLWGVDLNLLRPLKLRDVRGATSWTYQTAKTLGARMTWVLSNTWHDNGIIANNAVARPWSDWSAYRTWASDMAAGLRTFRPVDYIDVQNEPYVGYFPDDPNLIANPDTVADQIDTAAEGILTGDPAARVVGPSYSGYTDVQLRTYLDDAVERGTNLGAVNWHELSPGGGSVNRGPSDLIEHVANVRSMLGQRPSLGRPQIHINEFASAATGRLSGWGVGFIAALEAADVDLAMRSCADDTSCARGAELVDANGATLAPYWVHRFYADQTGRRLASTSTNGNVSSFATRDGNNVKVMVGRHNTCVAVLNAECTGSALVTGPTYAVPVTIDGLARNAAQRVVVQRIPVTTGPVVQPLTISDRRVTTNASGVLSVTLPTVADGEAWTVTVSPA